MFNLQLTMLDWHCRPCWSLFQSTWLRNYLKWISLVPCDWPKLCCQAWKREKVVASLTTAAILELLARHSPISTLRQSSPWRDLLKVWPLLCFILTSGAVSTLCRKRIFFSQKNPNIAGVAEEIFPRLVTSAKQQRYPCSGPTSDSTNDRKCFSTFNQIYKSTMAFSIGQYGAYSNPGIRTGGAKTKDFGAVSQADVTTEV